jgi:hypothetical protein
MIDGDSSRRLGPVEALTRAAPVTDEVACLIELENLRSGDAAAGGRVQYRTLFVIAERIRASMGDPNMIL